MCGHYMCQFMSKVDQKWNLVKLKSLRILLRITSLAHSHMWSLYVPIHVKSWPKVNYTKLQSVRKLLRITCLPDYRKSYVVIICASSCKKWSKWNWVKLQSVRTLLRITSLAHMKSYVVTICANSCEKSTKSEIGSSWGSHICSLFTQIHMITCKIQEISPLNPQLPLQVIQDPRSWDQMKYHIWLTIFVSCKSWS